MSVPKDIANIRIKIMKMALWNQKAINTQSWTLPVRLPLPTEAHPPELLLRQGHLLAELRRGLEAGIAYARHGTAGIDVALPVAPGDDSTLARLPCAGIYLFRGLRIDFGHEQGTGPGTDRMP